MVMEEVKEDIDMVTLVYVMIYEICYNETQWLME